MVEMPWPRFREKLTHWLLLVNGVGGVMMLAGERTAFRNSGLSPSNKVTDLLRWTRTEIPLLSIFRVFAEMNNQDEWISVPLEATITILKTIVFVALDAFVCSGIWQTFSTIWLLVWMVLLVVEPLFTKIPLWILNSEEAEFIEYLRDLHPRWRLMLHSVLMWAVFGYLLISTFFRM